MKFLFSKRISWLWLAVFVILAFYGYGFFHHRPFDNGEDYQKIVILNDNGLEFQIKTKQKTVADLLNEKKIILEKNDQIFPNQQSKIFNRQKIEIRRAVKLTFEVDSKTVEGYTLSKSVRQAILENNIALGRLDISQPNLDSLPTENMRVIITRINIEERTIEEPIDFKTVTKNDDQLSWREKKVIQPGQKGKREVIYRIHYKNGKEVERIKLSQKIITSPTEEIVSQGTYMKLGKASRGIGTWYAWKGGMFAASKQLPKGSFAKVTNTQNGKSIVVEINDYGPVDPKRIIDLDKVAFQKLAPLGAGVIHDVKVEQILN